MNTERKRILLVEDEAIIALAGRKLLEKNGYGVVVASTGEEAVNAARGAIDLILMDIDLGSGIKGPEAATRILAEREIPIIFLTSHATKEMVVAVSHLAHYGYIAKSAGEFTLISTIETGLALFATHSRLKAERQETDRKRDEIARENKALLKEVLQRLKRGIEVIEGLLSLEEGELVDGNAAAVLRGARRRLFALRILYDKLFRFPDYRTVPVREYLEDLAIGLARSHSVGKEIAVETYVDDLKLDIGLLLPLGMIVEELISMSLEHAFPPGASGMISLAAYRDAGAGIELVVSDDGIDHGADRSEAGGFGIELVNGLAKQLEATIERRRRGGTTYRIRFSPETEV